MKAVVKLQAFITNQATYCCHDLKSEPEYFQVCSLFIPFSYSSVLKQISSHIY